MTEESTILRAPEVEGVRRAPARAGGLPGKVFRSILTVVIPVGLVVGAKKFNETTARSATFETERTLCRQDAFCLAAIERDFDVCFDRVYHYGGRHSEGHVDHDFLQRCLTRRPTVQDSVTQQE